jgi:hypothetical protein
MQRWLTPIRLCAIRSLYEDQVANGEDACSEARLRSATLPVSHSGVFFTLGPAWLSATSFTKPQIVTSARLRQRHGRPAVLPFCRVSGRRVNFPHWPSHQTAQRPKHWPLILATLANEMLDPLAVACCACLSPVTDSREQTAKETCQSPAIILLLIFSLI